MKEAVIAFVPVLHAGYINFFRRHAGSYLFLISPSLFEAGEFQKLAREIRALDQDTLLDTIKALKIFYGVGFISPVSFDLFDSSVPIIMPDEDVSRAIAADYLPNHNVTFESVFLRYDLPATFNKSPIKPDRIIDNNQLEVEMIYLAKQVAQKSPDWWRQVGAVLVKDGQVLGSAYNRHMPSEHSLYTFGDPRNNFSPGEHLEFSSAQHAERVLISTSAKKGVCTAGASMFVSTFPCPPCAYDIVTAGISKVYFSEGFSALEAQETFKLNGVEIIKVITAK